MFRLKGILLENYSKAKIEDKVLWISSKVLVEIVLEPFTKSGRAMFYASRFTAISTGPF